MSEKPSSIEDSKEFEGRILEALKTHGLKDAEVRKLWGEWVDAETARLDSMFSYDQNFDKQAAMIRFEIQKAKVLIAAGFHEQAGDILDEAEMEVSSVGISESENNRGFQDLWDEIETIRRSLSV